MKALTLAIALSGALTTAHASTLRSEILSANRTITSAMKRKNFPALEKAMRAGCTSDFKYTEGKTSQTFDEMLQNMKMGIGTMKAIKVADAKLLTLKESGSSAWATTRHTMIGTTMGPDKKPHTMNFSGVSANTYVKQGGHWKMSAMTWKSQKTMMDGKPVSGMGG